MVQFKEEKEEARIYEIILLFFFHWTSVFLMKTKKKKEANFNVNLL